MLEGPGGSWFQGQDFSPCKLLGAFAETRFSTKDYIDHLGGLLETLLIRWILAFVVFFVLLIVFLEWVLVDCFPKINALKDRVLRLWMQGALFVE